MKATTLYKAGVDPYIVIDQEALDYHLTQGWVTDPKLVVEVSTPTPAPVAPAPAATLTPCGGCVSRDAQIADLKEQISDLEGVVKSMSATPPAPANTERLEAIKLAVSMIPRDKWQRASGGRPEMPLLADVAELTGFPVKSADVVAALPTA